MCNKLTVCAYILTVCVMKINYLSAYVINMLGVGVIKIIQLYTYVINMLSVCVIVNNFIHVRT